MYLVRHGVFTLLFAIVETITIVAFLNRYMADFNLTWELIGLTKWASREISDLILWPVLISTVILTAWTWFRPDVEKEHAR
jgi:hypothetical protein